ncbi:MAG: hypothetical protein ACRCUH_02975, partial [Shewanella sp.]
SERGLRSDDANGSFTQGAATKEVAPALALPSSTLLSNVMTRKLGNAGWRASHARARRTRGNQASSLLSKAQKTGNLLIKNNIPDSNKTLGITLSDTRS